MALEFKSPSRPPSPPLSHTSPRARPRLRSCALPPPLVVPLAPHPPTPTLPSRLTRLSFEASASPPRALALALVRALAIPCTHIFSFWFSARKKPFHDDLMKATPHHITHKKKKEKEKVLID